MRPAAKCTVAVATTLLVSTALGAPARAQDSGTPAQGSALRGDVSVRVDVAPGAPPEPTSSQLVDERALRYYASQYDYAKVDAEIARLKALYPDWQPPRDLFGSPKAPASDVDVSGLWAAYDRGDFAGVRREISALRQINPAWQPPRKLIDLMTAAEVRSELKQAAEKGDWAAIAAVHQRHPEVIAPDPQLVENLWIVAEAYHRMGADDQAYGLYRRVLDESDDADLRLSTLQKALANRSSERLQALIGLEEARPKNATQLARFEQIKKDFKGGAGGGAPSEQSRLGMALARVSAGKVDETDLAWIRSDTEKYRDADAALVLGWYAFDRSDWADAETWFGHSLAWKESPSAAEGLARTYMEQHRFEEAGALATAWRGRAPAFAPILADVERQRLWSDLQGGDPRQTLQVTSRMMAESGTADPGVLIARGWALYGLERPSEAAIAFRQAMEKTEAGSSDHGNAVYGLVHAQVKSGLVEDGRALLKDGSLSDDQRRQLEQVVTSQEAIDAYHDGRHDESLQLVRRLQGSGAEGSLATLEAWNLLELGRYSEAQAAFAELYRGYQSPEALKGLQTVEARSYRHD
jgi:hypothetical protein